MDQMNIFLDLIMTGAGVYLLYIALKTMRTRELEGSVLVGKTIVITRKSDVEGYISYICPKAAVFGVLIVISGLLHTYLDYSGGYTFFRSMLYFAFFAMSVIFGVLIARAQKKYLEK